MTEKITSASNSRVKRLTALRRKAKQRREEGAFILEGERLYRDTPGEFISEIYVTEAFLQDRLGGKAPEHCTILTPEIMQKVSDTETPQGVLCVAKMPAFQKEELLGDGSAAPFVLILENIQDPGNLGTMMRTAEAAGVTGILMSRDTVDLFNPKTVRATGSPKRQPVQRMTECSSPCRAGSSRSTQPWQQEFSCLRLPGREEYIREYRRCDVKRFDSALSCVYILKCIL